MKAYQELGERSSDCACQGKRRGRNPVGEAASPEGDARGKMSRVRKKSLPNVTEKKGRGLQQGGSDSYIAKEGRRPVSTEHKKGHVWGRRGARPGLKGGKEFRKRTGPSQSRENKKVENLKKHREGKKGQSPLTTKRLVNPRKESPSPGKKIQKSLIPPGARNAYLVVKKVRRESFPGGGAVS